MTQAVWRYQLCNLRRRREGSWTSLPRHDSPFADPNGAVIVVDPDDTRLPLREMGRVCHVGEDVLGGLAISTLATIRFIVSSFAKGRPGDDSASEVLLGSLDPLLTIDFGGNQWHPVAKRLAC